MLRGSQGCVWPKSSGFGIPRPNRQEFVRSFGAWTRLNDRGEMKLGRVQEERKLLYVANALENARLALRLRSGTAGWDKLGTCSDELATDSTIAVYTGGSDYTE